MPSRPSVVRKNLRVTTTRLPEPRILLRGIYVARLLLGATLLGGVLMGSASAYPVVLPAALLAVLTLLFTFASFWHSHRRAASPGEGFLYLQAVYDTTLLTAIVYLTGGPDSLFAPLYVLVICTGALLLPVLGGVLIALLAMVLYFASVWIVSGSLDSTVVLHLTLFGVVALVTGYLADRLRQTGVALGEVETELRQLRLDTSDILGTISTGVVTVDGEGRLAYMNPAAEELLGLPIEQWVGEPIVDMLDRMAPGLGSLIARSAEQRIAIRRSETDPVTEEGFVLGVSTTLVERAGDQRPAVTAIFQDITEKKRVEALRRRAERLEAVAGLSASLAHEIKNPLASIRSAVEQISSPGIDAADSQVLRALVVRESDRLSRLLTEFIDFARVRVTAPEPVDVASLVRQVVDLVRAHPDAGGREIQFDDADCPLYIRGGEDLLHRAALNLVLNAVQWAGPGGRVILSLSEVSSDLLSPSMGALSLIRFTVTDTGPGVPDDIAEHIFDPFFTRRPGGTGLGLALVQRAVEAHGGAVFVDNEPPASGLGATFTLYLPALAVEAPDGAASSLPEPMIAL